jgi:hypothetical protein
MVDWSVKSIFETSKEKDFVLVLEKSSLPKKIFCADLFS